MPCIVSSLTTELSSVLAVRHKLWVVWAELTEIK